MDRKAQEFARLIIAAGWSQAEAARRLRITPGAVSQICSGKTRPRDSTLNLLKLMVARENPEALALHDSAMSPPLEAWEMELLTEMRRLPEAERQRLLPLIKQMIRAMATPLRRTSKG